MSREEFLKLAGLLLCGMSVPLTADMFSEKEIAPALFIGHGNPMNALADNNFTLSLNNLGMSMKKPKAIVVVSAHWSQEYNAVSVHDFTDLMYDMYGFPEPLYEMEYPAPNAEFLTPVMQELFPSIEVEGRSLDHGAWSVLLHLFPKADIPVMQLAINNNLSLKEHFEVGKKLSILRKMGVMVIGSGNVTHNLSQARGPVDAPVMPWAKEFDLFIKEAIENRDFEALIDFEKSNQYARLAHPTLEHYIPLLYVAGASFEDDESRFIYEGIEHSSLSMRTWLVEKG